MINPELLLRMLAVAVERLPDHRVVLDGPTWRAMVEKFGQREGGPPAGGLIFEQGDDSWVVRQADHEDALVLADRVRKAGGTLIESAHTVIGIMPADEDDGA